jgi:hypothetical protein
VIAHEVLPAGSLSGGFSATMTALKNRGYTSTARKYLVFADDSALCGIAQMYNDSAKVTTNANNGRYSMFARVDSPCWPFPNGWHSTPAHELMHNLGGVQNDAPNSTLAGHCRDEADTMCYADGGANGTMISVCSGTEHLLDCREDDYYSTAPGAGSYLASHWNPADSSFLDNLGPVAPAPTVSITGASALRAGLAGTYTATSSDPATSYAWTATPAACIPGGKTAATVTVACPADYTGTVQLAVDGTGSGGTVAHATLPVTLTTSPLATMTTSFTANPASGPKGSASTLTAQLSYGGAPVRGTVTLLELVRGSYKAVGSAADTGTDGIQAWTVKPRTTTTYAMRVTYSAAGGWTAPAQLTTVVTRG